MKSVAVYSNKGGAGKSAVTVLLAEALACKPFRQRILVVDLDAQQSTATALLGDEKLHAAIDAGKSVTALLQATRTKPLSIEATAKHLASRSAVIGVGKHNFLQEIQILASGREAWNDLNDDLRDEMRKGRNGASLKTLLRDALLPLEREFDIALIDFPGHDSGPLVQCGLYAADRWLFPVTPDRMGTRDLDGSRAVIAEAYKGMPHKIKGLGTLFTMCQNRASGEYKSARNMLRRMADERCVPQLFSREAELSFWNEVKNALDDTRPFRTLDQKLGGTSTSPMYQAISRLAREVIERLHLAIPASENIEANQPTNAVATSIW